MVSLTYSPQGDGNKGKQLTQGRLTPRFTYLFPARGRKQTLSVTAKLDQLMFHLPIPRKGTETLIFRNLLEAHFLFHLPIPRKGTETQCNGNVTFPIFLVSLTYSPQGDGNFRKQTQAWLLPRVSLTYSPQGDGNTYVQPSNHRTNWNIFLAF